MKLNQILTISGKPGLYQLQSRTRTGFLALSLLDNKRISIGLRSNVSLLSEIAIYTLEGEKPLEEIFTAMNWRLISSQWYLTMMKIECTQAI